MNFIDFYTEIIPYLDEKDIINLSKVNKSYTETFTKNKSFWKQVLGLKYNIPLQFNNQDESNYINWMHVSLDLIFLKDDMKYDDKDIDYRIIYNYFIEKNQEIYLQDLIINPEKLYRSKNIRSTIKIYYTFLEELLENKFMGLTSYINSNKIIRQYSLNDNEKTNIIDIIFRFGSKKVEYLTSSEQLSNNSYIDVDKLTEYIINNKSIKGLLKLDSKLFMEIVNKMNRTDISYFQLVNYIKHTLGTKNSYYPLLLSKYAYLVNYIDCVNTLFEHYVKQKYPNNEGVDLFLSYLVNTPTFDYTYKKYLPIKWATKNAYIRTTESLILYTLNTPSFFHLRNTISYGLNEIKNIPKGKTKKQIEIYTEYKYKIIKLYQKYNMYVN